MVGIFNLHMVRLSMSRRTVQFMPFILANDASGTWSDTEILRPLPGIKPGTSSIRGKKICILKRGSNFLNFHTEMYQKDSIPIQNGDYKTCNTITVLRV